MRTDSGGRGGETIAFTGGGSAGHVLPAISVAQVVARSDARIIFFGRKNSVEERLAIDAGFEFESVPSAGLRRYRSIKNLLMPFVVLRGVFVAWRKLGSRRPRVLFSKGSFASVPVAIAAFLRGVPVVVHESDHSLGLANKIVGTFAKQVLVSFDGTIVPRRLTGKVRVVGQMVRADLATADPERFRAERRISSEKPVLLVYGGSSGSQRINATIRDSLGTILDIASVVHITGNGNLDPKLDGVADYYQLEYLGTEMPDVLRLADLVVARSGANTVAELSALEKPALLIPLPLSVSRGDQIVNAETFVAHHRGEIVLDEEVPAHLTERILAWLQTLNASSRLPATRTTDTSAAEVVAQILRET